MIKFIKLITDSFNPDKDEETMPKNDMKPLEEQRFVDLAAGLKHTHAGVDYYGPCKILMPQSDAEALAQATVGARIELRKKTQKGEIVDTLAEGGEDFA